VLDFFLWIKVRFESVISPKDFIQRKNAILLYYLSKVLYLHFGLEVPKQTKKIKIMSTLFNGQRDNKKSSIVRLLFSALIVVAVVSLVSLKEQTTTSVQNQTSFVPEMSILPAGNDLEAGKALYQAKACFACHGMNGEGNAIGPNLIDNFSKHGCSSDAIAKVIAEGATGTTMVAYKAQMTADEIKQVTAYIISIKGTEPANAKAAEGEECK